MNTFLHECRKIVRSLTFYLVILALVLVWNTQFRGETSQEIDMTINDSNLKEFSFDRPLLIKPTPADKDFGTKTVEAPPKIMVGAVDKLVGEYKRNIYSSYPFGYYKAVTLDQEQQNRVLEILREITGLTEVQLKNLPDSYFPQNNGSIIHLSNDFSNQDGKITVSQNSQQSTQSTSDDVTDKTKHCIPQISYESFKVLMEELDNMIGAGSSYTLESLITYFGLTPATYKDAILNYNTTIHKDKVTGAFARLFCDYTTLPLGLFPVFLVVVLTLKDRRSQMQELIYSRKISSVKLTTARYFAYIVMLIIPILLLSLESFIPLISFGVKNNIAIDYLAYIKYIFWWLLPTVMIVTSLGMFLTVLTELPVAIVIQLAWWFVDKGMTSLSGDYSLLNLMVRHNTLRGYDLIQSNLQIIWANRLIMTGLALLLVFLTAWIYEQKRRGRFAPSYGFSQLSRSFKNKFQTKHNA